MTDLERARKIFAEDIFATETTGITIEEVGEDYVICSLLLGRKHKNARDQVMGGVYFALADFAFAVAANFDREVGAVTENSNITFLAPAKGKCLTAKCRLIKNGKKACTYQVDITDEYGNLTAISTVNGIHI